jgi:hypothetical protein
MCYKKIFLKEVLWMCTLELNSPTNLYNSQRCKDKVNDAKDAILFPQHLRSNFMHVLGYSFYTEHHIFPQFFQMLLP